MTDPKFNTRPLTDDELEQFPYENHVDVAITGSDDIEYYGETYTDENGDNPQFVNDQDGEHIPITSDQS